MNNEIANFLSNTFLHCKKKTIQSVCTSFVSLSVLVYLMKTYHEKELNDVFVWAMN